MSHINWNWGTVDPLEPGDAILYEVFTTPAPLPEDPQDPSIRTSVRVTGLTTATVDAPQFDYHVGVRALRVPLEPIWSYGLSVLLPVLTFSYGRSGVEQPGLFTSDVVWSQEQLADGKPESPGFMRPQ